MAQGQFSVENHGDTAIFNPEYIWVLPDRNLRPKHVHGGIAGIISASQWFFFLLSWLKELRNNIFNIFLTFNTWDNSYSWITMDFGIGESRNSQEGQLPQGLWQCLERKGRWKSCPAFERFYFILSIWSWPIQNIWAFPQMYMTSMESGRHNEIFGSL